MCKTTSTSSTNSSTSSTCSELSPVNHIENTKCLVCSMPAKGNHFGVFSCRACAAFFRRSYVQKKEYKCRLKSGNCDVSGNDRYQCRACRLQKCKDLGMTPDNVQFEESTYVHDPMSYVQSHETPFSPMYRSLRQPKIYIDVSPAINKVKTVLASSSVPPILHPDYFGMDVLHRMQFALWNYRAHRKYGDLKFERSIVFELPNKKWEKELVRVADWMCHSDQYRALSLEQKMLIFRKVYVRWRKFEKWLISVDTFGARVHKDRVIVCVNCNAASLDYVHFDYSQISDRTTEELRSVFGRILNRMLQEVAKPMAEVHPSPIEMTYMLCQLVWNGLESEIPDYPTDYGDSFLNELSNCLHAYYAEQGISNYVHRLQKMMKIVNSMDEPSSSSSTQGVCKVCALTAHGLHFGVLSCRACAAFFRRTIVMKREKKYRCRGGNEKCVVDTEERYQCRFCRYQKCVALGMTAENVQWNRDSIPSTRKTKKKSQEEIPSLIEEKTVTSTVSLKPKTIMDVTILTKRVKEFINIPECPSSDDVYKSMNTLQKMEFALGIWREKQKPEKEMEVLKQATLREIMVIFEQQMMVVALWLVHFDKFRELSEDNKYKFFKIVWNVWRRFERYEMSVRLFGDRVASEGMFAFSHMHIANSKEFAIDFSKVSDFSNERIKRMFHDSIFRLANFVAKPLKDLKPSTTEVVYMLSQSCWYIAGKTLGGEVGEKAELVRDELANNLHQYYIEVEKRPNYAERLVRMMGIVNTVAKIHMERKTTMELARIFDVFKVDFSEPDIFDS
ncbi:unnamed protein product [Caenorhabditis angaria]|uniref:Uncharacterized protein n=1 Tax=Caenorhabditis angaria TaxID=860376 RepID=A0A9P1IUR2_9PELO|nr:unnamed protein product [Caenorhabditis angaria]